MSEHRLILKQWREDHKTGWQIPACTCGDWELPLRRLGRHMSDNSTAELIDEWRDHLPLNEGPDYAIYEHEDGAIETGQAHVCVEGHDHMLLALHTRLTRTALHVRGFWHGDVGDPEDAHDYIFPAGRVDYVWSYPWWDLDNVIEETLDEKPAEAEAIEQREREAYE